MRACHPCLTRVVWSEEGEGTRRAAEITIQLCVDDVLVEKVEVGILREGAETADQMG